MKKVNKFASMPKVPKVLKAGSIYTCDSGKHAVPSQTYLQLCMKTNIPSFFKAAKRVVLYISQVVVIH
jgi:hypothetical protein